MQYETHKVDLREYDKRARETDKANFKYYLEGFYKRVLTSPDMVEREYYVDYLKSKGFKFE